jgi:formylglycine-generating enzyme required for sulfatase activity
MKRTGSIVATISVLFLIACGGDGKKQEPQVNVPTISPATPLPVVVGEPVTLTVTVNSDSTVTTDSATVSCAPINVPASTGGTSVTCTPTGTGTYTITITPTKDTTKAKSVTITVNPVAFTVNDTSAEVAVNGEPAVFEFSTAFTFEADAKAGCDYDADDSKKLVCAPTALGNYTVTLTATTPAAPQSLEVSLKAAPEVIEGMVYVEAGTFTIGGPQHLSGLPQFDVQLTKSFYIGETEVTQAKWNEVMGIAPDANPSTFKGDNTPQTDVLWTEIQEFITKLNGNLDYEQALETNGKAYRLPTEAEWEYALRGGSAPKNCDGGCEYSGSNNEDEVAAVYGPFTEVPYAEQHAFAVKTKAPNELGIYDMSGNVQEYVADWYQTYAWYESNYDLTQLIVDPTGPSTGFRSNRVVRGTNYSSVGGPMIARTFNTGANRRREYGFRLALDIAPAATESAATASFFESAGKTVSGLWDSAISGVKSLWNSITK